MLTILPYFFSAKYGQANLLKLKVPNKWTFWTWSHSLSLILAKELSLKIPALLTKTSMVPYLSITFLMISSAWEATSCWSAQASPPAALISSTVLVASLKSLTTTLAPYLANHLAYSLPKPAPAPVIKTTLSFKVTFGAPEASLDGNFLASVVKVV